MSRGTCWVRVAAKADLIARRRIVCTVAGVDIVLIYSSNEVLALENKCTHLGNPLHEGRIMAGTIICPFHGACFDLRTGESIAGPAVAPVRVFKTRVEGEEVSLELPQHTGP